jgi:purine-binding chemotaxis protein CheW
VTNSQHGSTTCVVCRVGTRTCAFPLVRVAEVTPALPVRPLAGLPDFVLGLSVVRGSAIPVVDAARLLAEPSSHEPRSRFVVLHVGTRRVALAVAEVVGIRTLAGNEHFAGLPPLLAAAGDDALDAVGTSDSELLFVLGAARLLGDADWAHIERGQGEPG